MDWNMMGSFLPIERKDKKQMEARKKIWFLFDEDGSGYVEFEEALFGLKSYFQNEAIIEEARPAILKAYNFAKDYLPAKKPKKNKLLSTNRRRAAASRLTNS